MPAEEGFPHPSNDPGRLAQLRAQHRPTRGPSPTLTAALSAPTILPGREHEAWEIWRGLCARSAAGDAAAGEDMVMLTLLLANELNEREKLDELRALTQTALEAARLLRHRQEQLGRLCRIAVRQGDNAAALDALTAMSVDPPDIESDSELRVSAAAVATLVGDSQLVLSLLGARAADIPIDETLRPLAIALRANALEQVGQLTAAAEALRELPHFAMLADLKQTYASLKLCPRSATLPEDRGVSVHRNLQAPLGTGLTLGPLFLATAIFVGGARVLDKHSDRADIGDTIILWLCVLLMVVLGVPMTLAGISSRNRVTFLRQHGLARRARVIQVEGTTSSIGKIPIYRLTLELAGPKGTYRLQVSKTLHAPEASAIVGQSLGVLINPADPSDAILDEATLV